MLNSISRKSAEKCPILGVDHGILGLYTKQCFETEQMNCIEFWLWGKNNCHFVILSKNLQPLNTNNIYLGII